MKMTFYLDIEEDVYVALLSRKQIKYNKPNKMDTFIENVHRSHSTQTALHSFCRHTDERTGGRIATNIKTDDLRGYVSFVDLKHLC